MKTMTLAKLKKYTTAYNIKIDRAVEKDDLIDAILAAKVRAFRISSLAPNPLGLIKAHFPFPIAFF